MNTPNWRNKAACAGVETTLFYPEGGQQNEARDVIEIFCGRCPVRAECLAQAELEEVTHVDIHGIRGGLTRHQRRARLIARNAAEQAKKPPAPTGCGTYLGYALHRREYTPVCDPCREAARIYQVQKRARRRGEQVPA